MNGHQIYQTSTLNHLTIMREVQCFKHSQTSHKTQNHFTANKCAALDLAWLSANKSANEFCKRLIGCISAGAGQFEHTIWNYSDVFLTFISFGECCCCRRGRLCHHQPRRVSSDHWHWVVLVDTVWVVVQDGLQCHAEWIDTVSRRLSVATLWRMFLTVSTTVKLCVLTSCLLSK